MKLNICGLFLALSILTFPFGAFAESSAVQSPVGDCTSTNFNFKLFNAVVKENNDNVIVSPFSTYIALSMALNGAAGSTAEQMARTLGITGDTMHSLNERNRSVLTQMNSSDKVKLKIANAIFADKNTPFKTSFVGVCKQMYDAKTECYDSKNSAEALKSINTWCDAKTDSKIPVIVDSIKPNEKMLILNAVYFKGEWASPFKKAETEDDKFITASGEITDIKMMHQCQKLFYFKDETFKAVCIPYAGDRQTLCIFLPNKKIDLSLVQKAFTAKNWREWMPNFRPVDVNLSLPKFSVCFSQDLSSALQSIGMTEAFDAGRADFSKLVCFGYKASISRVLQKTYLDIDEQGTQAAAATAIGIAVRAAVVVKPHPVDFRVDHPFLLALVDNDSNEILFLGSIVKP